MLHGTHHASSRMQAISAPAQPAGPGGQRGPADNAGQQQGSLGCWADHGGGKQVASNRNGSVARGSSSCSPIDQVYVYCIERTAAAHTPPSARLRPNTALPAHLRVCRRVSPASMDARPPPRLPNLVDTGRRRQSAASSNRPRRSARRKGRRSGRCNAAQCNAAAQCWSAPSGYGGAGRCESEKGCGSSASSGLPSPKTAAQFNQAPWE